MSRRPAVLLASVLALAAARPGAAGPAPEGTPVRFATDDGLSIAATWWPLPGEFGPAVVLLPMYGGARTSWRGEVPHLLERGLSVLAIDPRGHGDSASQGGADLSARVKARDGALFAQTWRDVLGAIRWLVEEGGCDPKRIGLVGASVGASVALDAARRHPDRVAAVLGLTPGAKYLGLDAAAHAAALRADLPVAFVVHRDEADGAAPVWGALLAARGDSGEERSLLRVLDTPPPPGGSRTAFHGLRMLGAVPLVEDWIAAWLARALGTDRDAPLLDGEVAAERAAGGAWANAPAVTGPEGSAVRAVVRGTTRLVVGGTVPETARGLQLLVHVRRGDPRTPGAHAWGNLEARAALPGGEMTEGTTDASAVVGWPEPPVVLVVGRAEGGSRPFEGVVHLPPLPAEGHVQAWITVGVTGADGTTALAEGVRRDDPSTWVEITRP
jgi:pimeloyl-ACP methyl ester carboxylesterase